ncbi:nucleotidyltransferase domain-containing protein [Candidatus Woesearchaeota archaeon]|nr:nucleotidyltransferase domain-containing protein [Candidatus Woesearchaeota archaeon]
MKSIKSVLNEVLMEIQPDRNYEKEIFERLSLIIRKINQGQKNIKAILGGSGAKGTWLKTFDADIFVLFGYKKFRDKSDKLSDILEKILKKKFKNISRLHGSRDYFQIKQGNFTFEIVPILKIQKSEQAKNITDVSPLHSRWVAKHKKLISEMKLTKQFCQAQNVYGAESYIMGFSGYICEILAVYYGSFLNLIRNASKWDDKIVIDVQKYYKGKDVFKLVNTSKLISPLIVIDPVQKDRNAAAALSAEKFEAFKKAAKEFLRKPSKELFSRKDLRLLFLKEKAGNAELIMIKTCPLSGKTDVVGSKLLKIHWFLNGKLRKHGFKIKKADWEWDKKHDAVFYFLFEKKPLPKTVEIWGPPINIKQHVDNFKKVHKKTFIKKNKIYAMEQRNFTKPIELLKSIVKERFVTERCKTLKIEVL